MALDLTNFDLVAMLRCRRMVTASVRLAPTMETAASRICKTLYDELTGSDGAPACALVRCYKTHPYGELEPAVQRFVERQLGSKPPEATKCLTLMATAGAERSWNSRHRSVSHRAIPLPSAATVDRAPMIRQLLREFGVDVADVVGTAEGVVRNREGKTYGVFHVGEAEGSPFIPAQSEFVKRYGIRSVVGFGGELPRGELFAVILFTRVQVSADTADRFRSLALDVKACLHLYGRAAVFDSGDAVGVTGEPGPQD